MFTQSNVHTIDFLFAYYPSDQMSDTTAKIVVDLGSIQGLELFFKCQKTQHYKTVS